MSIRVKICFVVDCTGSMDPWIQQTKTKMTQMTEQIQTEHPNANILVSFIGYRDYGDTEQIIEFPFDTSHVTMRRIRGVFAEGGDDEAEDVATALRYALHQDWSDSDVRNVIHIADAPAHGLEFHSPSISDRFSDGDPDGYDPRDFLERMSFLNMNYTFVKICSSTDKMIDVFHSCYKQGGSFNIINLEPQGRGFHRFEMLSAAVSRDVTQTITNYISSQVP